MVLHYVTVNDYFNCSEECWFPDGGPGVLFPNKRKWGSWKIYDSQSGEDVQHKPKTACYIRKQGSSQRLLTRQGCEKRTQAKFSMFPLSSNGAVST